MRRRPAPSNTTTDGIGESQLSAEQRGAIDRLRIERGWGVPTPRPMRSPKTIGRLSLARVVNWLRGR